MNKEILLDTNIFRRYEENRILLINDLNKMKEDGFSFKMTDLSLFESLDHLNNKEQYFKFLNFLFDYEISPIHKEMLKDFNTKYYNWFKEEKNIIDIKKEVFPSFCYSLSSFWANFTNAIILFLANKLETDYSSSFYSYILDICNFDKTKAFYESLIEECYLVTNGKFRNKLKEILREIVIKIIIIFELSHQNMKIDNELIQIEYDKKDLLYKNKTFKDILSSILNENDIIFGDSDLGMDQLDIDFIKKYITNILCHNKKFDLNDIVDYLNFKYAKNFCYAYFTADEKSITKITSNTSNLSFLQYINKSEQFIKKYKSGDYTK